MSVAGELQMRDTSIPAGVEDLARLGVVQPIHVLGFSLLEAGRLFTRAFQKRSRALALNLMECRALITLAQNEGVTQRRLAELIAANTVALVRMLDRLEASGWTERRPFPGDRRARSLAITAKGRAHVRLIWKIVEESELAAFASLSGHEILLLAKVLDRVRGNLTDRPE
jgi:MarR family transcriptional regulator for hemolysin